MDELNRAAKPSGIARTLGFDSGKHVEYKILDPDWTIEFHPDAEDRLEPRGYRDLFRTRVRRTSRIRRRRDDSARHQTVKLPAPRLPPQLPSYEGTRAVTSKPGSTVFAYIRYEDAAGPQVFPVSKDQVVIGRGGKSFWVDLKLNAPRRRLP